MLRVATIGTSVITEHFLAAARGRLDVVVCHSRDPRRAAEFARAHGVAEGTADLAALLVRDDLDGVYVASPNAVHAEQVRVALEAGKHVLAEKPLTTTEGESAALFALAEARGLVLLEAMRSAFDPGMAAIRDLLPALGTLRRATFRFVQRSSRYSQVLAGETPGVFDPALGGGALTDLGVYCVRPMVDLWGPPQAVVAASVDVGTGADGATTVLATYPGMVVDLTCSKITVSELPSEIEGELATMTIDHISAPRRLAVTGVDGHRRHVEVEGVPTDGGRPTNMGYEIDRFVELVASGTRPVIETRGSLLTARVVDLARDR